MMNSDDPKQPPFAPQQEHQHQQQQQEEQQQQQPAPLTATCSSDSRSSIRTMNEPSVATTCAVEQQQLARQEEEESPQISSSILDYHHHHPYPPSSSSAFERPHCIPLTSLAAEEKQQEDAIEVEAFQDEEDKTMYYKIIYPRSVLRRYHRTRTSSLHNSSHHQPPPPPLHVHAKDDDLRDPDDGPLVVTFSLSEDDGESSFFDSLCFHPCHGCTDLFHTKTILRKTTALGELQARNKEAPVISDRQVSFSQLKIAEYDMTLGNHPAAVSGPPVMLDWDSPPIERVVTVDEYELSRQPRRKRKQLKLSFKDRQGILFERKGFTEQEVNQAWAEALQIRKQREETLNRGLILMFFDDVWESTCRKYHRLTNGLSGWI